jgi:hypothetical protein
MKKLIYCCLILLPSFASAQSTVFTPYSTGAIVIDTIAHKSSSPLPFDRNFTLQYTLTPTDSIFRLFTYKVSMDNGVRDLIPYTITIPAVPLSPLPALRVLAYATNTCNWDTLKNLIVINEAALHPNTLIDIAVLKKLNKRETDSLMLINQNLYLNSLGTGTGLPLATIQSLYLQLINDLTAKTFPLRTPFNKPNWNAYQHIFTTNLLPFYTALNTGTYSYAPPGAPAPYDFRTAFNSQEIKTFDSLLGPAKIADDDLVPFASLVREGVMAQLLDGTADITAKYPGDIETKTFDYQKRLTNLTAALAAMDKVIALFERAQMGGITPPTDLYEKIIYCRALLLSNKTSFNKNYKEIIAYIRSNSDLSKEFWLMSENDFTDLTLLSKDLLLPDLGIATLVLKGHEKYRVFPRPFIGVNIYFRPVDKTLKESYFPSDQKDLFRLLSLQVGLTYGKLDGKEFNSLFNDFSLMAGPSVRLVRWFRMGLGTVLTQQTNANPLITQSHTNFGYYMSLSFDIDILSNASTATARVFK